MVNKSKWMYLIPLLALGYFFHSAPLSAREPSVKELVNSSQSAFNPFSFFDEHFSAPTFRSMAQSNGISMYEQADQLIVQVNLPGLDAEDIELTYDRGTLQIRGKKGELEEEQDERNYYHRSINSYAYNIDVPHVVDESILPRAEFKNGQMKVIFQKQEVPAPTKIEIQTN